MLLELETTLFDKIENLKLDQFLLLSLILDKSKINRQGSKIISRISDDNINELVEQGLITILKKPRSVAYEPTSKLLALLPDGTKMWEQFLQIYPNSVIRPDGTKAFLKTNLAKAKTKYIALVNNSEDRHLYLVDCLQKEITDKMNTGKIGYMKGIWKWLVSAEWEAYESQEEQQTVNTYGTNIL